jgi:hypothetical protein
MHEHLRGAESALRKANSVAASQEILQILWNPC